MRKWRRNRIKHAVDGYAGAVPEKRTDAVRPPSDAVEALTYGLTADRIKSREEPTWRVWLVVAAAVVGLVFPWWYGVISCVVDIGRVAGWW